MASRGFGRSVTIPTPRALGQGLNAGSPPREEETDEDGVTFGWHRRSRW